jgi:hypothetical protein
MAKRPGPDWERVQEIFLAASDLPVEGQSGYLDAACGDDAELRAEVESLLHAGATDDWLATAVRSEAVALLRGLTCTLHTSRIKSSRRQTGAPHSRLK